MPRIVTAVRGDAGGGLRHIVEKHGPLPDDFPARMAAMDVRSRTPNRVRLYDATHDAIVRLDYDGKPKRWLLTAYERDASPPAEDGRAGGGGDRDGSPGAEAPADMGSSTAIDNGPDLFGTGKFALDLASDGEGRAVMRTAADVLAELDADDAALAAVRECLP